MLKVKMDAKSKEPETLEVSGNLAVVTAEIAEMIRRIYNLLLEREENAALALQAALTALIENEDSPVWKKGEIKGNGVVVVFEVPKREAE